MALLTGPVGKVFDVGPTDDSCGPLFEHGPAADLSIASQDDASPATALMPDKADSSVPKSVALPQPIVAIVKGPTLRTRQLWEGRVTEVRDTEFVAVLTDATNPSNPDEQVVFACDEISEDDRALIAPGSGFYWTVGTKQSPVGQRENVSIIQFRRLPSWTRSSLEESSSRAREIWKLLQPAQ